MINFYLKNITEVNQHMRCSLSSTRDIETRGNHVCTLPATCQMFAQSQFEEVESHVNVVRSEPELVCQSHYLLPGISKSDLSGLSTNGAGILATIGLASSLPVR